MERLNKWQLKCEELTHWRCGCGQLNAKPRDECKKCGASRVKN